MTWEYGLVAHYGVKSPAFQARLAPLQEHLSGLFAGRYQPRDPFQFHATMFHLGRAGEIDPAAVRRLARAWEWGPFDIRFGGTVVGADPGIDLTRTFDVAKNWCLVHGWPVEAAGGGLRATDALAVLRREAERFGFRHLYRDATPFGDPNCYAKIGTLEGEPGPEIDMARAYLAAHPFRLGIGYRDLAVVKYDDASLPRSRTIVVPFAAIAEDEHAWDAFEESGAR